AELDPRARARSGALEYDDRDLAVGAALVGVIVGPLADHRLPDARLLIRRRGAGVGFEDIAPDLDLDLRFLLEVEIPRGRLVGTALGGDDRVGVLAVGGVDQRGRAGLARSAALRRQQEGLRPLLPVVAFLAVGGAVAVDVFLTEEHVAILGDPVRRL